MFGIDTQEKMPEAYLTSPAAWDGYVGAVWQGLLALTGFAKDSCVVDLAPGSSAKLGYALSAFDYQGELYVIDASAEALKALEPKYRALMPKTAFHWLCGSLKEQVKNLPVRPDYLLGNHILDDMLLAAGDTTQEQKDTFSWASAYTNNPSEAFQQSWQRLKDNPALLSRCTKIVRGEIIELIDKLNPGCTLLSQYPSSTLSDNGMEGLNEAAFAVFSLLSEAFKGDIALQDEVQAQLNKNKNFGNRHIGEHVLNAKYWMLCRHKKR